MAFWTRRVTMGTLIGFLGGALTLYLVLLLALVVFQRRMMYFPGGPQGPAAAYGFANAKTITLRTSDGQTIVAWYQPAADGKPLFLVFHGNGGTLAIRADWLHQLTQDGSGFLAIDYRGYGGSTGSPSETGLLRDGDAAYAEARALGYAPDRIVTIGESLGTGVAIALAAKQPMRALVLDSAFSSAADIAAARYWMFPVRLLMRDPFDSWEKIGTIAVPKLFIHAAGDPIIPLASAKKLFAAAREPKTFVEVPITGHMVLDMPSVMARMKAWLAALPPPPGISGAP